jgi:phosphoglycolate phosphatase-like HAD superfamily hydrolase
MKLNFYKMKKSAYLFDMDGTLVNSERLKGAEVLVLVDSNACLVSSKKLRVSGSFPL